MPTSPILPIPRPTQRPAPIGGLTLLEITQLVKAEAARAKHKVTGAGQCIAVLDTGVRTSHEDFVGRVAAERDFTIADEVGKVAVDDNGHGTNVAGIVCANGPAHKGMAPGAKLVVVKILGGDGLDPWKPVIDGLAWVRENASKYKISAATLSLGVLENWTRDDSYANDPVTEHIRALTAMHIPVCVAAGNQYGNFRQQGMAFPAIVRETISVGSVYDATGLGPKSYPDGAEMKTSAPDRIAAYSQRLHASKGGAYATDIFAPGGAATSTGKDTDRGESVLDGTSQATPVVAGIIALMQELHQRKTHKQPTVDDLRRWIQEGADPIADRTADHDDNVPHTEETFRRINALGALDAMVKSLS